MSKKNEKPRRRRVNGEGTFYQRPDKSWVHQITLGYKPDGTPERKAFSGACKEDCLEKKQIFLQEQLNLEATKQEDAALTEQALRLGHSLESETLFSAVFHP